MKKKIKVLQVIPKLGYGGAETGCYDLAHYLSEQDCRSFIATSGGELLKYVKKNKVKVFKLPVHSKNPILILKAVHELLFKYPMIHLSFIGEGSEKKKLVEINSLIEEKAIPKRLPLTIIKFILEQENMKMVR